MSVEQTDVVDIVSIERETGNVILTISDHLDWSDSVAHQRILQKKLIPIWLLLRAEKSSNNTQKQETGQSY